MAPTMEVTPSVEILYSTEEVTVETHERGRSVLRWSMLAVMWALTVFYILPHFVSRAMQIVTWPGL